MSLDELLEVVIVKALRPEASVIVEFSISFVFLMGDHLNVSGPAAGGGAWGYADV